MGTTPSKTELPSFRRLPNGTGRGRAPSHPDWENPPTPYAYPRLGRKQARRTLWIPWQPVIAVVVLAALVAAAVFLLPSIGKLVGAGASPSPSPTVHVVVTPAPVSSPTPAISPTESPSPSPVVTPVPVPTSIQYTVQAGDTLSRIATKFGIKTWQLLKANPDLAADPNTLVPGMVITIPVSPTPAPTALPS